MKFNNKIIWCIILTCIFLVLLFFVSQFEEAPVDNMSSEQLKQTTLYVKLYNDNVYLFENNKILKQYEIDIKLLPGNDIAKLTKGIAVSSESEADLLAEDFDG